MKQLLLITFFFTFPFYSISQNFDYELGETAKVVDADSKKYFHKNGQIMVIKEQRGRVTIQKWDAGSMKEISRNKYDDFPGGFHLEKVGEFNGKYLLFFSAWHRKDNLEQLFVRTIDFDKGKFIGKGKRLIKNNGKLSANAIAISKMLEMSWVTKSPGYHTKFNIRKSFDGSKILIQYRKVPELRDDHVNYDVIGLNSYNNDLKKLYQEEIKMPYTESKMDNIDYTIDSSGHIYMLTRVFKDDTRNLKDESGNINYHFELLRVDADSKKINKTTVKINDLMIKDMGLFNQANDQIFFIGIYSKGEEPSLGHGLVTFKVGAEDRIPEVRTFEIPLNFMLAQLLKKEEKKKKKKKEEEVEIAFLELRKIVENTDGSMVPFLEEYDLSIGNSYTKVSVDRNGRRRTVWLNEYNNVLVIKIDNESELVWMEKLNKIQGEFGKRSASFKHVSYKNIHYLFYMDNPENKELGLSETPELYLDNGKEGIFTAFKIDDETGQVGKIFLFETGDVKDGKVPKFYVRNMIQSSDNEFFIETFKNKKEKEELLIKINLNE